MAASPLNPFLTTAIVSLALLAACGGDDPGGVGDGYQPVTTGVASGNPEEDDDEGEAEESTTDEEPDGSSTGDPPDDDGDYCIDVADPCVPGEVECCAGDCSFNADSEQVCCKEIATSCGSGGECCTGTCIGGSCSVCLEDGVACESDNDCCGGLCWLDVCTEPVPDGGACDCGVANSCAFGNPCESENCHEGTCQDCVALHGHYDLDGNGVVPCCAGLDTHTEYDGMGNELWTECCVGLGDSCVTAGDCCPQYPNQAGITNECVGGVCTPVLP